MVYDTGSEEMFSKGFFMFLKRNKNCSFVFLQQLGGLFGFVMLAYTLLRIIFYTLYFQQANIDGLDVLISLVHGLRFDLAALMYINAPVFLLSLMSLFYRPRWLTQRNFSVLFVVLNLPWIALGVADLAYFEFTDRRTGFEVLAYAKDLITQLPQLAVQYWYGVALSIGLGWWGVRACLQYRPQQQWRASPAIGVMCVVLILSVSVLAIRGGLQKKPLSDLHALTWSSTELFHVTLNSPYVFLRAKTVDVIDFAWFNSQQEAYQSSQLAETTWHPSPQQTQAKANVMVIILESFHYDMIRSHPEYGTPAPFLAQLVEQGLFFKQAFANGRLSIDAPPSTMIGIPNFFKKAFIRLNMMRHHFVSLPNILHDHGYQSAMYHGAYNGSLYLDTFAQQIGFDEYHGFNEYEAVYPSRAKHQSSWGVFDHDFLSYVAEDLSKKTKPFLATLFTLSSHNPFEIPASLEHLFPIEANPDKFYRAVKYADYSLQNFFKQARTQPWYNNTLFVITADHTSIHWSQYPNQTALEKHHVPMLLFQPAGVIAPRNSPKVVQQIDIPATVLDYLGLYEAERHRILPFGHSMLNEEAKGVALFRTNGHQYMMVTDDKVTLYDKKTQQFSTTALASDYFSVRATSDADDILQNKMRGYLQMYMGMFLEDILYPQQLSMSQ
jgi:phosphoglycerol transferase MdoB-like AlkP superfamily enzyme